MGDDKRNDDTGKTRQDLLDELAELRGQLAGRDGGDRSESALSLTRPITRRRALTDWVAPAVLAMPLATLVASQARAGQPQPTTGTFTTTYFTTTGAPRVPVVGLGAAAVLTGALAAGVAKVTHDRAAAKADDGGADGQSEE